METKNEQTIPDTFTEPNNAIDGAINPITGKLDRRRRKRTPEERKKISEKVKLGMELYRNRMKVEKGIPNIFKQFGKKSARIKKEMALNALPKDKGERDTIQKLKKEKYFLLQTAGLVANKKDAALKAGFDPETAERPEALIETGDDWEKIMKKYFKDDLVASRHLELIVQNKDKGTAMKGIELVYKMKKRFDDDQGNMPSIKLFVNKLEIEKKDSSEKDLPIVEQPVDVIDEVEDLDLKQTVLENIKEDLDV